MERVPKDRALPFIVVVLASYRQRLQRQAGLSDGFPTSQSTATIQHHNPSVLHRLLSLSVPQMQTMDIAGWLAIHTLCHSTVQVVVASTVFSNMEISGLLKAQQCGFKATMRARARAGLHGHL
jgi:hypothetical protein